MDVTTNCNQNRDPLRLVREGTNQDERFSLALKSGFVSIDERKPQNDIVFAREYSSFLNFYDLDNNVAGNWRRFFEEDVTVQLAVASVENMESYMSSIKEYFDFLTNFAHKNDEAGLKLNLGFLFGAVGSLARQIDQFKEWLPKSRPLRTALDNLISNQLALALERLMGFYKSDIPPTPASLIGITAPDLTVLGAAAVPFNVVYESQFSREWGIDTGMIAADSSVFGSGATVWEKINHIATHNLFSSIFDQFLKAYARLIAEARQDLVRTLTKLDNHAPHYALFLAFLRLFRNARRELNTLTDRHLDFYYREILRLNEQTAQPGQAHLLVELAKQVTQYEFKEGELFKAGKDDAGKEAFYSNDRSFVANQAKVSSQKTVYRHHHDPDEDSAVSIKHNGRIFASPIANSEDGIGGELTSPDKSWHPFFNRIYKEGELVEFRMPKAEIGFAIASHYLFLQGGQRIITVDFQIESLLNLNIDKADIICLLSSEKGWVEANTDLRVSSDGINLQLKLKCSLNGSDPPVTPYVATTHGLGFDTNLPVLLLKLRHAENHYVHSKLEDVVITNITIKVEVSGLKALAVSNDFGPVDLSKPFQPFGAAPVANNSLIIGSKEIFQKGTDDLLFQMSWLSNPVGYKSPGVTKAQSSYVEILNDSSWNVIENSARELGAELKGFSLSSIVRLPSDIDLSADEPFQITSRQGYLRLHLSEDFGQVAYQADLLGFLASPEIAVNPGSPPVGPTITELKVSYSATQNVSLTNAKEEDFNSRFVRFFHLAPFGQAEQHPLLKSIIPGLSERDKKIFLLPQFKHLRTAADDPKSPETIRHEAEFYIGITDLKPPQNLALLFQIVDGTAHPLVQKPPSHIHWSYLKNNEWISFAKNEVQDHTNGLLISGIITFSVPRGASDTNTLLPTGVHWLRASVGSASDAVCRLQEVAAQALEAKFKDKGNDPAFSANPLAPGTISKLDQPVGEVKKIDQPFPTFGGKGKELPKAFYTRVSERLRHKDRAIALWDYERLVLEAFPEIYKVKCLNHTHYEPDKKIYRELAPGHVTIITIPNLKYPDLRNPLKPYTGLGLLERVEEFLIKRLSCFSKPHVKNPQFEDVRVSFKVRFYDGVDETFHEKKLRQDITRFLSPWAYPGGKPPSFGGKVYKSVLENFVEEQPYVDYILDFQLFHDIEKAPGTIDKNEVEGSEAVSILVSAPSSKHEIKVIKPSDELKTHHEECPCEA
jgi:hypothetical protein